MTRRPAAAARRASLDKRPQDVAAMFDGVARRYDLTNTVLSLGRDRHWRRSTRQVLQLRPGERVLDLAAGTGVSTAELARAGVHAVACDFSLGMLRAGRANKHRRRLEFVAGDGTALPFRDGAFDAATISFGLRNIADVPRALAELARVVRPGGRLVVCEFSSPTWRPLRVLYLNYLMRALPWIARRVAANPEAYVYLAESIRAWPPAGELGRVIGAAGWSEVRYRSLTGGIVALHRATRDASADGDADDGARGDSARTGDGVRDDAGDSAGAGVRDDAGDWAGAGDGDG